MCRPKRRSLSSRKRKKTPQCGNRRKRRSRGKKRKRCMKPGPLTNNPYLNFLRSYRRKHCGLTPQELIQKGARKWVSMTPEQQARYRRQVSVNTGIQIMLISKKCFCFGIINSDSKPKIVCLSLIAGM